MKSERTDKLELFFAGSSLLNKVGFHSVAAYSYSISVGSMPGAYVHHDGSLSISGCSKTIDLDLDFGDEAEYLNSMYKLETLLKGIQEAKEDLKAARVQYVNMKIDTKENEKD